MDAKYGDSAHGIQRTPDGGNLAACFGAAPGEENLVLDTTTGHHGPFAAAAPCSGRAFSDATQLRTTPARARSSSYPSGADDSAEDLGPDVRAAALGAAQRASAAVNVDEDNADCFPDLPSGFGSKPMGGGFNSGGRPADSFPYKDFDSDEGEEHGADDADAAGMNTDAAAQLMKDLEAKMITPFNERLLKMEASFEAASRDAAAERARLETKLADARAEAARAKADAAAAADCASAAAAASAAAPTTPGGDLLTGKRLDKLEALLATAAAKELAINTELNRQAQLCESLAKENAVLRSRVSETPAAGAGADVRAALVGLTELLSADKLAGKRGANERLAPFAWMAEKRVGGAVIPGVTMAEAVEQAPLEGNKSANQIFYRQFEADRLLLVFTDDMNHGDYVVAHRQLVTLLAAVAHAERAGGPEAAEAAAKRYLNSSLTHFAAGAEAKRTRLVTVQAQLEAAGGGVSVGGILSYMDAQFAVSSATARDKQHVKELAKLTVANGVAPSTAIAQAVKVHTRKFRGHADLAEQEARSWITAMLARDKERFPFLQRFHDIVLNVDFAQKPLVEWQSQFSIFEMEDNFVDGMEKAKAKAPSASKSVNLLTGGMAHDMGTGPLLGADGTSNAAVVDMLKRAVGALAAGEPESLVKGGTEGQTSSQPPADEGTADMLRRLIAMMDKNGGGGGGFGTRNKGEDWVKSHGVPGYAAPNDRDRPHLHIGKIAAAKGETMPAECPKDPNALVGPECLCNKWKKIPAENWFYSPDSFEFKSKAGCNRVKPADLKNWGFYHKLGKCASCRVEAHVQARADPSKVHLLEPISRDSPDCVSV